MNESESQMPPPDGPLATDWVPLQVPEEKVMPWLAALQAIGIPCDSVRTPTGTVLLVPPDQLARAARELQGYEETNAGWPPPAAVPTHDEAPGAVLWTGFLLVMLLVFHLVTGSVDNDSVYFEAGVLDVSRTMAGEWWRTVTALTLHADFSHVAANALALLALGIAASHQLGPGLAWALALLGGIGGNYLEAWMTNAGRRSLGASTMVFALLALLAALRFVGIWRKEGRPTSPWARSWLPPFAALGALGFLGTSHGSDIAGHALGFVSGGLLGLAVAFLPNRRPGDGWQVPLCILPLALVAWAWHLALSAPLPQ